MTFPYFDQIVFSEHTPIRELMNSFDSTAVHTMGQGFALIVDNVGRLSGVVSEGDIRRGLAAGVNIDAPAVKVVNRRYISASATYSSHQILRLFENSVRQIPILDDFGKPIDLILFSKFTASARKSFRVIRARAPVRVSLCGGGTDMTFYFNSKVGRVLSTTINKYSYCSLRVRDDNKIRLISRDYNAIEEAEEYAALKYGTKLDLIKACIRLMEPDFGFDLETFSEIDPGTGLGGSSAMAAAVIGALNHFRNETHFDLYHLADLAYQAERIELNIEGGWQDQYASVFGGINLIEFKSNDILVSPLRVARDTLFELRYNLLLFRFGGSRKSGDIAADQKSIYQQSITNIHDQYDALSNLTIKMQHALLRGNLQKFGELLHDAWEIKKRFSPRISTSYINDLYDTALHAGAVGGKVLGAGESGYLLLYCDSSRQAAVVETLREKGAELEPFDFTNEGLQVWAF
jgi:D-glycero-alpha-D-manno-heptose-7-phosphate kinase